MCNIFLFFVFLIQSSCNFSSKQRNIYFVLSLLNMVILVLWFNTISLHLSLFMTCFFPIVFDLFLHERERNHQLLSTNQINESFYLYFINKHNIVISNIFRMFLQQRTIQAYNWRTQISKVAVFHILEWNNVVII